MSTTARPRPGSGSAAAATLRNQFDPEVIAYMYMRAEFDAADADNSGEIDSQEAAALLAKLGSGEPRRG
jgi:hypothetical protein